MDKKITHLNTQDFVKLNVNDNITTTHINANQLKIHSIEGHKFRVNGQILDADPNFIYSFGKLFGLTNKLQTKMIKGDKQVYRQIIGHMNDFFINHVASSSTLILIGEPTTKKLIGITWKDGFTRLTNQKLQNVAQKIITNHVQFKPQFVSMTNSRFIINLVAMQPIVLNRVERYATGVSLINDISGTYAVQYIGNLKNKWFLLPTANVVSNGTIGDKFEDSVGGLIKSMMKNDYDLIVSGVKSLYDDLSNNYTNIATVESLYKIFKTQINKVGADTNTIDYIANMYLPEMKRILKANSESVNKDLLKMKKPQKRQVKVSTHTMNLLTRCLSSVHDSNVKLFDNIKFVKDVSNLFKSNSNVSDKSF